MQRKILKPKTRITRDLSLQATVVLDQGGESLLVREDNAEEPVEWLWSLEGKPCVVLADPVVHPYEYVVTKLTDQIYDAMDFEAFKDVVEHGLMGVRQMSNEALEAEWLVQFSEPLDIADPESNPYIPPLEERL